MKFSVTGNSGYVFAMALLCISAATQATAPVAFKPDPELVQRGKYITIIGGCNDCHSPGYAVSNGDVPEAHWLTGDSFGWRGPWGTTYGTNLRIFVSGLTEEQWIDSARNLRRRPPMPWFNLNIMQEQDLRGLYHYIKSLGEPGQPAPPAMGPGETPATPHANWVLSGEN